MPLPKKITGLIPHQSPMLLVDELLETQGDQALVRANLGASPLFCAGGYLDRVVGVELMAQAYAAFQAWRARKQGKELKVGYLVGVQRAKLGDLPCVEGLEVRVATLGSFEDFVLAEGRVFVRDSLRAEARLKLWSPWEGK
jgi:predicted hotdog family 3-hydroxylacyl-ACP dehydratase